MARLNEPPIAPQPSAETADVVKRRYQRQNRELAKTNSQQSTRIRSLENDCSRLLAENLSLREQVLSLHNKVESRPALDHIDVVKAQLEAKLLELGGLVAGLGKTKSRKDREGRRKSLPTARRRSGEERQWRSGLGLQEVENGMLPTIVEHKSYPRRTMGYVDSSAAVTISLFGTHRKRGKQELKLTVYSAEELQDMLCDTESQSPDLGPPPISRFENEEPIAFNASPEEPVEEMGDDQEPTLSANLETRKKRRESGPKLNARRVSVFESPKEIEEEATKSTRIGSKRKFSVQEDEDKGVFAGEAFRFSRRATPSASEAEVSNEDSRPSSPERPILKASKCAVAIILTKLTVLEPVNTDLTSSPKKQRSSQEKLEKPEKPEKPSSKSRGRPRLNITRNAVAPDFPILQMPEPVPIAEIVLESLPPKTPAVESIFSPPSTEPSTQRPESKDTPPPGDLISTDQAAARPGRRSRPQVSYKEPSLNTKMRRPDAKLVDAIIERRTSVEPQTAPPTTIKRDSTGDLSWKPISSVAARGGEEEPGVGSPLRQKLDRRDQDLKTSPVSDQPEERSTASKAISALINETSTAKRKATASASDTIVVKLASDPATSKFNDHVIAARPSVVKQEPQEKDNLAVFDFTDSPPADTASNPRTRITDLAKAARNARRHSAMPAPTASVASESQKVEKAEGALPSLHKRTGSGTEKTASTTTLSKTSASLSKSTSVAARPVVREKKTTGSVGLPSSGSSIDPRVKMDNVGVEKETEARSKETSALRAERAASRRKSMML